MPSVGDVSSGTCSWCQRPVVKVWRRYDFCSEGFWSDERCPCGKLENIGSWRNGMRLWGNKRTFKKEAGK